MVTLVHLFLLTTFRFLLEPSQSVTRRQRTQTCGESVCGVGPKHYFYSYLSVRLKAGGQNGWMGQILASEWDAGYGGESETEKIIYIYTSISLKPYNITEV